MKKLKEIGELIFILITFVSIFFAKEISIRILASVTMLSYLIISRYIMFRKRKNLINELNEKKKVYIECRENNFNIFLISTNLIIFSAYNLTYAESMGIIIVYVIVIIIAIIDIIEGLRNLVIIDEDSVLFYNDIRFDYSEITEIKYRDALFSNKKIIKLRTKVYEKEIIPKVKDFEKIKVYLEENVNI